MWSYSGQRGVREEVHSTPRVEVWVKWVNVCSSHIFNIHNNKPGRFKIYTQHGRCGKKKGEKKQQQHTANNALRGVRETFLLAKCRKQNENLNAHKDKNTNGSVNYLHHKASLTNALFPPPPLSLLLSLVAAQSVAPCCAASCWVAHGTRGCGSRTATTRASTERAARGAQLCAPPLSRWGQGGQGRRCCQRVMR